LQVPIFISVYKGLNEMAELPVASMQTGGLLWFTDLTICDPYYALPIMTVSTLLITLEVCRWFQSFVWTSWVPSW